ncbi:ankyrin repeat and SOCS box protein 10 isoform X1 [Lepisosteus oculatus]|uniref:Ankyrin repeat and SOCS box containing 10 n=1 Tax=Lepisosteus oculatus TaxID=7918 RepID=W5MSN3_LEPOC|nr:PREDICTED: ankyrin repeat and SOCS box protein 10 isoform X1 [Lepisosteus oculatus]
MSHNSFVFTSTALRSFRLEEDLLERQKLKKRLTAPLVNGYLLRKEGRQQEKTGPTEPPTVCRDLVVHNALFTGDLETLQQLFPKGSSVNFIIESRGEDLRWVSRNLGIWSLTYEQELTTPLHITAGRGYTECLKHLLMRGAEVDMAPGGKTALHEACENSTTECARLLLAYGGSANSVTEDGFMPLHLCTDPESLQCAKLLLQFGASVNGRSLEEDDTPLHLAARYGLPGHIDLYLRYGAAIERKNKEGQTPLNAACSQPQSASELEQYYEVCKLLVSAGADIHTCDQDRQTPLHMACKYANPSVVDLLLQNRANVNIMSYSGNAPMHNILKGVAYKLDHHPERIVRSLLNYGSIRVWPGALPKVLKYCCTSPKTIEVLLNTYDRLKITDSWTEAVPPEVFEEHSYFYESLFSLANTPRSLQHLARCKLRNLLEKKLRLVVSELGLPTFLQNYLLLDFRGYLH